MGLGARLTGRPARTSLDRRGAHGARRRRQRGRSLQSGSSDRRQRSLTFHGGSPTAHRDSTHVIRRQRESSGRHQESSGRHQESPGPDVTRRPENLSGTRPSHTADAYAHVT